MPRKNIMTARTRRRLLSIMTLIPFLLPLSIGRGCCDGASAVAIPFRNRKRPWRRSSFFTVQKSVPPLTRDVSVRATTTGANSTTSTIPYSKSSAATMTCCPELPVVYTNSPSVVSKWLSNHVPSDGCVLGFDVESIPNYPWMKRKASFEGPATVQLATPHSGLVIHLADVHGKRINACGSVIEAVLRDHTIVKAGVDIDNDMLELYSCFKRIDARSRLDVGGVGGQGSARVSLKRLTKCILGVDLIKARKLSTSNWGRVPLTNAQLAYSARDAWAGAAILQELAILDPDTYGTQSLVDMLQSETPLRKLHTRATRRKRAKEQLKSMAEHYHANKGSLSLKSVSLGRERVRRLKRVLRETAPDRLVVFDVERLGIAIPSNL